jgi:ectoine hydroxylase-related dioxygenase (phytanoyl-CoA dioxygenase family)
MQSSEQGEIALNTIVADFATRGFATVPDLVPAAALAPLRAAYDALLGCDPARRPGDRMLGGLTRQIMQPERAHPVFADNTALVAARAVAAALTGSEATELFFSMLIFKPPHHPHATPWHQDLAYAWTPVAPAGSWVPPNTVVQFWVALEDVDAAMGCMSFVPWERERPLLGHVVASGDPSSEGRLLAIPEPESSLDLASAVTCPLRAGSATVHAYTTPHHTGPNHSERGRRAYIISFADPDTLRHAQKDLVSRISALPSP